MDNWPGPARPARPIIHYFPHGRRPVVQGVRGAGRPPPVVQNFVRRPLGHVRICDEEDTMDEKGKEQDKEPEKDVLAEWYES